MVCIYCGADTQVINSRPQKRTNQIWRRRRCQACGSIFTTDEVVNYLLALRVKDRSNKLSPLSRDILFISLYKSLGHRSTALADASGLSATILAKITPGARHGAIQSDTIKQTAQVALNRFDKVAATHYRAFHT